MNLAKPEIRRRPMSDDEAAFPPWNVWIPPRGPQDMGGGDGEDILAPYGDSYWPTHEAACAFVKLVTGSADHDEPYPDEPARTPPRKGVTAWEIEPMEENGDDFFVLTFHHGLGLMTRLDLSPGDVRDLAGLLMSHDYPALARELRGAALAVAAVSDKLAKDEPGSRANEAWPLIDSALDLIDSALRSLEAEEDDEWYPGDPAGTADVIAAAIDTNPRKGATL